MDQPHPTDLQILVPSITRYITCHLSIMVSRFFLSVYGQRANVGPNPPTLKFLPPPLKPLHLTLEKRDMGVDGALALRMVWASMVAIPRPGVASAVKFTRVANCVGMF
jgi:hypothetical protein